MSERVVPSWMVESQRESSANSFHYKLSHDDDDNSTTTHSIANFRDWTPPDSSYGAAIPVGGWIPKRIRRNIERSLSICIVVLIVYVIVTASLRAERNKHDGGNNNSNSVYDSGRLDLDDDRYIAYDDAMYVRRDDDEENEMNNEHDDEDDYFEEGEEEEDGDKEDHDEDEKEDEQGN